MKKNTSQVKIATSRHLRKVKLEKIKSMKGKLQFDMTANEIRHGA